MPNTVTPVSLLNMAPKLNNKHPPNEHHSLHLFHQQHIPEKSIVCLEEDAIGESPGNTFFGQLQFVTWFRKLAIKRWYLRLLSCFRRSSSLHNLVALHSQHNKSLYFTWVVYARNDNKYSIQAAKSALPTIPATASVWRGWLAKSNPVTAGPTGVRDFGRTWRATLTINVVARQCSNTFTRWYPHGWKPPSK